MGPLIESLLISAADIVRGCRRDGIQYLEVPTRFPSRLELRILRPLGHERPAKGVFPKSKGRGRLQGLYLGYFSEPFG